MGYEQFPDPFSYSFTKLVYFCVVNLFIVLDFVVIFYHFYVYFGCKIFIWKIGNNDGWIL